MMFWYGSWLASIGAMGGLGWALHATVDRLHVMRGEPAFVFRRVRSTATVAPTTAAFVASPETCKPCW